MYHYSIKKMLLQNNQIIYAILLYYFDVIWHSKENHGS